MSEADTYVFRDQSRFWIQRVVVPILVCIGAAGNILSIIVLTRRRMRSSTNAYLTALAVADLIYLLFVLLLSFTHYPNIHDHKFELYWRFYGISHWLCDAASSTSVWLTVSFTMERYIVVCHPMKGKVLCTERRAKSIIAIISILCIILTATTPFEYQLAFHDDCIRMCEESELRALHPEHTDDNGTDTFALGSERNCSREWGEGVIPADEETIQLFMNSTQQLFQAMVNIQLMNTTCCVKNYTIKTEGTSLGKNRIYRSMFYWFSAIVFAVLPLALIATFNCFLIHSVYKSYQTRKVMTNSQEQKSQTQENRITLLLISIVVLFLVCQIPTASFLIYEALVGQADDFTENIKAGLGNIFNSLLTLNASCNFILYCLLSDKYRRTCKALFFHRDLNRNDSLFKSSRHSLRMSERKLLKRGKSTYVCTPKNLETYSLNSFPRSKSMIQRPLGKAQSTDLVT
ncbi:G-protein coupled receptor daf-37-like [Photinus pyralis]|uniref:G-protein coupled receptors family 1 profile domain-containing protein n=1 Tax=Photinus pyralis TaxID=7054 RepID=A0A1Y1K1H3_PHOPY|nr:G-protein coupled receptor daf-37-like [Photinus pyralis]